MTRKRIINLTFTYDGSGKLSKVANNLGRALSLGYSGTHISTVTDETGRSVSYGYDGSNNLTRQRTHYSSRHSFPMTARAG